jgi:peptide/nickel transport system substrate-binding protein
MGEAAWFGWRSDDKIETLRTQWIKASDSEAHQEIAMAIQQRAFESVPCVPTGAWKTKTAYRNNLKDLVLGPAIFQWNVEKV